MCVLELSKCVMYEYHYDYMMSKYGANAKLMMTDTDSLLYHLTTKNMQTDKLLFDFSNNDKNHFLYDYDDLTNAKKPGLFKDENAGNSLTKKPDQEVLAAIKKLAVREENTMVARVTLHNMRQERDEPVRNFCKFLIKCHTCNTDVNYTDTIIRNVLARGISDPEIQLDRLGNKNQDRTLEEVTQFVEAKDSGKRSASRLLDSLLCDTL
ncbi:unnamed protein product [Mytilus coruscus]|uniref:Uncharacterized protein n=1 Tax=Mytilus coruscus TaxID=42192 RepID=A0A6J8E107_MYTCO|nr:unnamed protein product [Mytilus coruscus]